MFYEGALNSSFFNMCLYLSIFQEVPIEAGSRAPTDQQEMKSGSDLSGVKRFFK